MRFLNRWSLLATIACGAALTGCSTVQTRIKEKPAAYEALSPSDRELVARKEIRTGFTRDAVYIAWGRPDRRERGVEDGRQFETWIWYAYMERPAGYAYDPFPYYHGAIWMPVYETVVYPWRAVTFVDGRVTAWRMPDR